MTSSASKPLERLTWTVPPTWRVGQLLDRVPQHGPVRPHDALRMPGRAGGEDDLVRVVHRALGRGRIGRRGADDLLVEQVAQAPVEADDRAQVGYLPGAAQLEDGRREALLDDDRPRARAAQQVG